MEDKLSVLSDDVVTHILALLPPKSLLTFKCTCKRWCSFISEPEFQRKYPFNSKSMSSCFPPGIFSQLTFWCCDGCQREIFYVSTNPKFVSKNVLDFLPVRAALVGSSNGILCCRSLDLISCKIDSIHNALSKFFPRKHELSNLPKLEQPLTLVFYICNPATKEWISLMVPPRFKLGKAFGFSFDPDGPSFTLVGLQHSQDKPDWCSFVIYDSKWKSWRVTKEFACFALGIRPETHVFLNGRNHWITYKIYKNNLDGVWEQHYDFYMVVFDITKESCQVIKLPHIVAEDTTCPRHCCLGVSEGHILYVCAYRREVKIWQLHYNEPPYWVPVAWRFPSVPDFFSRPFVPNDEHKYCTRLKPRCLYDGVLFHTGPATLGYVNIKSGEYVPDLGVSSPTHYDPLYVLYWPTTYPLKRFEIRWSHSEGCYPCSQTRKRKRFLSTPKRSPLS